MFIIFYDKLLFIVRYKIVNIIFNDLKTYRIIGNVIYYPALLIKAH